MSTNNITDFTNIRIYKDINNIQNPNLKAIALSCDGIFDINNADGNLDAQEFDVFKKKVLEGSNLTEREASFLNGVSQEEINDAVTPDTKIETEEPNEIADKVSKNTTGNKENSEYSMEEKLELLNSFLAQSITLYGFKEITREAAIHSDIEKTGATAVLIDKFTELAEKNPDSSLIYENAIDDLKNISSEFKEDLENIAPFLSNELFDELKIVTYGDKKICVASSIHVGGVGIVNAVTGNTNSNTNEEEDTEGTETKPDANRAAPDVNIQAMAIGKNFQLKGSLAYNEKFSAEGSAAYYPELKSGTLSLGAALSLHAEKEGTSLLGGVVGDYAHKNGFITGLGAMADVTSDKDSGLEQMYTAFGYLGYSGAQAKFEVTAEPKSITAYSGELSYIHRWNSPENGLQGFIKGDTEFIGCTFDKGTYGEDVGTVIGCNAGINGGIVFKANNNTTVSAIAHGQYEYTKIPESIDIGYNQDHFYSLGASLKVETPKKVSTEFMFDLSDSSSDDAVQETDYNKGMKCNASLMVSIPVLRQKIDGLFLKIGCAYSNLCGNTFVPSAKLTCNLP